MISFLAYLDLSTFDVLAVTTQRFSRTIQRACLLLLSFSLSVSMCQSHTESEWIQSMNVPLPSGILLRRCPRTAVRYGFWPPSKCTMSSDNFWLWTRHGRTPETQSWPQGPSYLRHAIFKNQLNLLYLSHSCSDWADIWTLRAILGFRTAGTIFSSFWATFVLWTWPR